MYNKRVWEDDDLITPSDMNRIENGIYTNNMNTSAIGSSITSGFSETKNEILNAKVEIIEKIDNLSSENENSFSEVLSSVADNSSSLTSAINSLKISVNENLADISSQLVTLAHIVDAESSEEFENWKEDFNNSLESLKNHDIVIINRISEIEEEFTRVKDLLTALSNKIDSLSQG